MKSAEIFGFSCMVVKGKMTGTNVWGMLKCVVGVSVVEGSVLRFGGV